MVSENPFNEPSILSEQKQSSLLEPDTNFIAKPPQTIVTMTEIDNSSKTAVHLSVITNNFNKDKITNHNVRSTIDDDILSSDIELNVDESEKEMSIGGEDATKENEISKLNNINSGKDEETIESIDNDLNKTAHLVENSSFDDFDKTDFLSNSECALKQDVDCSKSNDSMENCTTENDIDDTLLNENSINLETTMTNNTKSPPEISGEPSHVSSVKQEFIEDTDQRVETVIKHDTIEEIKPELCSSENPCESATETNENEAESTEKVVESGEKCNDRIAVSENPNESKNVTEAHPDEPSQSTKQAEESSDEYSLMIPTTEGSSSDEPNDGPVQVATPSNSQPWDDPKEVSGPEVNPPNEIPTSEEITQDVQICDSTNSPKSSPLALDDDVEPHSVESAEILIDSDGSEVMDVDNDKATGDLDSNNVLESNERLSISENLREEMNLLLENTAKEVENDEINDCVQLASEPIASTSEYRNDKKLNSAFEVSLNRLKEDERDPRKRKIPINDDHQPSSSPIREKRQKISDAESSGSKEKSISSPESKKKGALNRARKHTSSMHVSKTIKEIEKKIRDNFNERNKEQESSTSRDTFESFDLEIQDNEAHERCDDVPNDLAHRITLNTDVVSSDNLKNIFRTIKKKLTRRQLEEIVIQKCCEMISDSNEIGDLRKQIAELQQAEFFRKQKILNLEKQIHQLKAVCQRYLDQVHKSDKRVSPIKITRSVGLQVAIDSSPHIIAESNSTNPRTEERLKKLLLSVPAPTNRKPSNDNQPSTSRPVASSTPSAVNYRNIDTRVMNGNSRICSPSSSNATPPPLLNISRNKKLHKSNEDDVSVIDLTDKDDKNENEGNIAASNLLASVNGKMIAYVPVKVNQDQNRQVIKPGTPILVNGQLMTVQSSNKYPHGNVRLEHPAPVPCSPPSVHVPGAKPIPPKPNVKIDKNSQGIMLSWDFPGNTVCAEISSYQIFAYQETNTPPSVDLWKVVGDVDALPLPMACTLTQFVEAFRYHFIVRAVDVHGRYGPFSAPRSINL